MGAPLPSPIAVSDLTPALKAYLCNGCGPTEWKFRGHTWRSKLFAPPTPGGSAACNQHDLDYWVGGTQADKDAADARLRDSMIALANQRWFLARWVLRQEARLFYDLVQREGHQYFFYGPQRTRDDLNRLAQQLATPPQPPTSPHTPPRTAA